MTENRKRYSAEFKAKVALEAIRGDLTVSQLVAKRGVHQALINAWKRQGNDYALWERLRPDREQTTDQTLTADMERP